MKRIVAVVLLVFILSIGALADGFDFSAMTIDELQEIRSDIEAELVKRGVFDHEYIYKGQYIAGEDIKEGAYILTYEGQQNVYTAILEVYSNIDDRMKYVNDHLKNEESEVERITICRLEKMEEGYISLLNGNVLVINATCRIRPAENESWRP